MTGDALDRAAKAAFDAEVEVQGEPPYYWDTLSDFDKDDWRMTARAALRVMADEIRAAHQPYDLPGSRIRVGCLNCVDDEGGEARWPCPTVRILDRYVGEQP